MKLQFLIFSIFLITLVANKDITNATILNVDSERTFISLIFNQSQYFTMYAIYNCKYTFKIKAKSTSIPSSSSLSLLYIGHKYFYPNSIITLNNEYGSLNNSYSSINSNYTTYEYSCKIKNKESEYITFILTPNKYIDSVSIVVTKIYLKKISFSYLIFILVFFTIFIISIFIIAFYII